jgi:hypothetical protein
MTITGNNDELLSLRYILAHICVCIQTSDATSRFTAIQADLERTRAGSPNFIMIYE